MKKLTLSVICVFLTVVFCEIKAGKVLLVNLCKKDKFKVLHMATTPKQEEISRRPILDYMGFDYLKNVRTEAGEQVWAAGTTWRRLAKMAHYIVLELQENGDQVAFLRGAKKGWTYGGDLISDVLVKGYDFIRKIRYIHEVIVPNVNKFSALQDKDIITYRFVKQSFKKMKRYKKFIEDFSDMPVDYADLSVQVDSQFERFATRVSEKNGGIALDELYSRRNIREVE